MKKRYVVLLIVAVVVVAAAPFLNKKLDEFRVVLPELDRPPEVVKLDQNWTDAQRQQFHHTPQGTRLIPADWFKALEQPCFSPFGCGKFADPAYLSRFGFIPSQADALNPDGLPIGFALDKDFVDPIDKSAVPVVGLTCAACHTGELHYGKYAVVVEGAPAMIEVAAFQKALGLALGFNTTFPFKYGRYGRFERSVLGPNATDEQKAELRRRVDAFVSAARHQAEVTQARKIYDNPAGFMRTDALTRIGNQVFAADTNIDDNYAVADSPVRFPQIWDASWFNWVQYNSSIADPLARNIGEALGVRAVAKLYGPDAGEFENSINMAGLRALENLLSGPSPFKGLASPKWPSVFPALDPKKVSAGAALYKENCQRCHLPPLRDLSAEFERLAYDKDHQPAHWWQSKNGSWYLQVTDIPLEFIGTDPRQATDFMNRKASSGDLGKGVVSASVGLDLVTMGIANRFFRLQKISPEDQVGWAGGRDPARSAHPRGTDLQGAPAERHLGGRAVSAQRIGAHARRVAVAGRLGASADVLDGQQAIRSGEGGLLRRRDERRDALRHDAPGQREYRPPVQGRPARQGCDRPRADGRGARADHRVPQVALDDGL